MNNMVNIAILVGFLAAFNEWVMERLFGTWVKGPLMVWLSAGLGVALCVLLRVDGLQLLGLTGVSYPSLISYVLTGVVVGGGSNVVHKFLNPSAKGPLPPAPPSVPGTPPIPYA